MYPSKAQPGWFQVGYFLCGFRSLLFLVGVKQEQSPCFPNEDKIYLN